MLKLQALFRAFRETNDLVKKLNGILGMNSNSKRKQELMTLFKLSSNSKGIDFLNLLRSRNVATNPIPMLPPPYPGPRHHVMSVSSFRNYIDTNVYVGKPTSLQSILFYADAVLLERNGKREQVCELEWHGKWERVCELGGRGGYGGRGGEQGVRQGGQPGPKWRWKGLK